jgi:hypothetical protein
VWERVSGIGKLARRGKIEEGEIEVGREGRVSGL